MASNKWLDVAALIEAAGSLLWPAVALHGALAFVLGRTCGKKVTTSASGNLLILPFSCQHLNYNLASIFMNEGVGESP
jgi:hypothetical protein